MGELGHLLAPPLKNSGTKQASWDVQMFEGYPGLLQVTQLYVKNENPTTCKNHVRTITDIQTYPQPLMRPNPPTREMNAKMKKMRSEKMLVATHDNDLN